MRRPMRFLRTYTLLCLVAAGLTAGAVLALLRQATAADWVLGVVSLAAVPPVVGRLWRELRGGSYTGMDGILGAVSIIAAIILRQYWAAAVIALLLAADTPLRSSALRRAQREVRVLEQHMPAIAHVQRKRSVADVATGTVAVRDTLIIRPGETVPADALVLEGTGNFDESLLLGDAQPVAKQPGDSILGGSVSLDGTVTAQVVRTAVDSQYRQVARLVRSAGASPAPFVSMAGCYSITFTAVAFAIAAAAWLVSHQPLRFLEVIVVATPCPLVFGAPLALAAGMSRAARDGIIIKTEAALEQLANVKTFAFGKRGTLVQDGQKIASITAYGPFTQQEVLAYAAALEQAASHPLAQVIIAAAKARGAKPPKAKHVREVAGQGLEAQAGGKQLLVGRLSFLAQYGVILPKQFAPSGITQPAVFVAIQGVLAGYILFSNSVRPNAKPAMRALRRLGIAHIHLLTGDSQNAARAIARPLGITEITADALPGDKLHALEAITERPLAFAGDGVHDAALLTAADVGIALDALGSTAASEAADVVVLRDDLADAAQAVAVSRRAFRVARQTIAGGIGLSLALMLIFASGVFPPIVGIITQECLDVAIIAGALRARATLPARR